MSREAGKRLGGSCTSIYAYGVAKSLGSQRGDPKENTVLSSINTAYYGLVLGTWCVCGKNKTKQTQNPDPCPHGAYTLSEKLDKHNK